MKTTLNQEVAKRIKELIKDKFKGIDSSFAKKAGISTATIQKYVNGISVPGGENLAKMANAANVSIDWLLTGQESDTIQVHDDTEKMYVEKLLRILRSNDELMINAIIPNLDAFDGRLIPKEVEEVKKTAG